MFVLVITGGLGAGKSTASRHLAERGAVVLDLDEVAKSTMRKGSPVLERIAQEFGDVLLADGSLDAPALARAAFVSPEAVERLNAIVHPAAALALQCRLDRLRGEDPPPQLVVVEVPLLAEAPHYARFGDRVVALVAPEGVRLARVVDRGMPEQDARRRLRAQATDAERAALADDVVVNAGEEAGLLGEIDRIVERYVPEWGTGR